MSNGNVAFFEEDRETVLAAIERARRQKRDVVQLSGRSMPLERFREVLEEGTDPHRGWGRREERRIAASNPALDASPRNEKSGGISR